MQAKMGHRPIRHGTISPKTNHPDMRSSRLRSKQGATDKDERVIVAVRVKPTTHGATRALTRTSGNTNQLKFQRTQTDEPKVFAYDHVFEEEQQADVYQVLGAKLLSQVLNGYNSSVFAYGQTGSGKTHTMIGPSSEPGLVPRLCEGLFNEAGLSGWTVHLSYFEIYNEQVVDLLSEGGEDAATGAAVAPMMQATVGTWRPSCVGEHKWAAAGPDPKRRAASCVRCRRSRSVREDPTQRVASPQDVEKAPRRGRRCGRWRETAMNAESSRSHAIVQLSLAETGSTGDRMAQLNLIDLAGSESVGRSHSTGERPRGAQHQSLVLGSAGASRCLRAEAAAAAAAAAEAEAAAVCHPISRERPHVAAQGRAGWQWAHSHVLYG